MGDSEKALKLYELYLEDLGRIGLRHETARQFYVGALLAITGVLAYANKDGIYTRIASTVGVIAAVAGAAVCLLWFLHMRSFATLFKVKKGILKNIERDHLPIKPFIQECDSQDMKGRLRLTTIDTASAVLILFFFVALGIAAISLKSIPDLPPKA